MVKVKDNEKVFKETTREKQILYTMESPQDHQQIFSTETFGKLKGIALYKCQKTKNCQIKNTLPRKAFLQNLRTEMSFPNKKTEEVHDH